MIYILIGNDQLLKDEHLKRLKQLHLPKDLAQFNLDTLYSKEITLSAIQEKLLLLPVNTHKRMLVIRDAHKLSSEVERHLLQYARSPSPKVVLVMDFPQEERDSHFLYSLTKFAKVVRLKQEIRPNGFTLSRSIEARRPETALKSLKEMLELGDKPEMVLGALRYSLLDRQTAQTTLAKKRLSLLLRADLEIKTGLLKPGIALEKLVVKLCLTA